VTDRRLWQLEGDLRQALENYFGGMVSGPWDKVVEAFAEVVQAGHMNLEMAAHINLLLLRTTADDPGTCAVCDRDYP
jgi:hypothetical protein